MTAFTVLPSDIRQTILDMVADTAQQDSTALLRLACTCKTIHQDLQVVTASASSANTIALHILNACK